MRYGPAPEDSAPASGVIGRQVIEALGPVPSRDAGGQRRLRIFMPADSPHINLCKSVMSAVALGYPLPTLLNWSGGV